MSQAATLEPVVPDDFADDSEALYEVVNGQRVELPPMGAYPTLISVTIQMLLGNFAHPKHLGNVVSEMLFLLTDADGEFKRRPDVAFVSYARWPAKRAVADIEAWEVIPNLAVEVISRTERFGNVLAKLREYFEAGVEAVWVVVPSEQLVCVYESPTRVMILDRAARLDGGTILPGLRLPVGRLFRAPGAVD